MQLPSSGLITSEELSKLMLTPDPRTGKSSGFSDDRYPTVSLYTTHFVVTLKLVDNLLIRYIHSCPPHLEAIRNLRTLSTTALEKPTVAHPLKFPP
jgi:hypothetical protein